MKKLNAVLATEKGIKTRIYAEFTEIHKASMKSDLFEGFHKTYQPREEDDPNAALPPQSKRVQLVAVDLIRQVGTKLTELFDISATRDWTNCKAKADLVVDGKVLIEQVPATHLLFLDKQMSDLLKFLTEMVELDPSVDWKLDDAIGYYKADPVATHRTEKKQRAIVLYAATPEHPAQTQLITEDQIVGHWQTIRYSGAIARTTKQRLLDRTRKLAAAVKEALERANMVEVEEKKVGDAVFGYLFEGV